MKRIFITAFVTAGILALVAGCGKKTDEGTQTQDTGAQPQATQQPTAQPQTTQTEAAKPVEHKRAETPAAPKERKVTIPDSTQLQVTLIDTVQTNQNQVGDHFKGTLAQAVEVSGKTVLPQGSQVDLVITKLVKGGTLKTPPEIAFAVESVTLPNGETVKLASQEFSDQGRSHTRREVGMIGGGAAAGAIIGAIAGKGAKGAAIGAVAGAAAGTGAAAATGRQNLVYGPGSTMTFTTKGATTVVVPNK